MRTVGHLARMWVNAETAEVEMGRGSEKLCERAAGVLSPEARLLQVIV